MTDPRQDPGRILVVGAGIGGLMAARTLAASGHRVTLVERSPQIRAVGAGLVMPASVVGTLADVGVDVRGIAQPIDRLSMTTPRGGSRLSARGRVAFARPELIAALAEGLDELVDLRIGVSAEGVRQTATSVACDLAGETEEFDLVVGADGMRSSTRESVCGPVPLRFSRQVCWRGIIDADVGPHATEMWSGVERIGIVPLTRGRGYVYLVRSEHVDAAVPASTTSLAPREAEALAALSRLPDGDLLRHELWELDRPCWGAGRVVLLGDAAHAVTPNLGLGAFLAIEDAVALTRALRRSEHPFVAYRRSRAARVRSIQLASRAIGRVAHDGGVFATAGRRLLGFTP